VPRLHAFSMEAEPIVPRAESRSDAKGVTQSILKGVPVGDGKTQMFCHCPVFDHIGGVIVLERQGIFGRWPFVSDFTDFRKRRLHKIEESGAGSRMNSLGDCKQVCIMSEPGMY
jgi:hypothetical protein